MNVPFDYVAIQHLFGPRVESPDVHIQWQDNFDDIAAVRQVSVTAGRFVACGRPESGWSSAQVGLDVQAQYVARDNSLALLKADYPYVTVATDFLDADRGSTYQYWGSSIRTHPKPATGIATS